MCDYDEGKRSERERGKKRDSEGVDGKGYMTIDTQVKGTQDISYSRHFILKTFHTQDISAPVVLVLRTFSSHFCDYSYIQSLLFHSGLSSTIDLIYFLLGCNSV